MSKIIDKMKYIIGLDDFEEEEEQEAEDFEELEIPLKKEVNKGSKVVSIHTHTNSNIKLVVYEPEKFEEVTKMVEDLKIRKLIVLNLEEIEAEIKKQIFNFINGAVYALEGNIKKVSKDIFVVAPSNVEIDAKLKEELKNKGLFPWQK
ncbi:hypothetical protein CLPU_5c00280 [Gottschalkia purinilytica]|uniref:Cell division protein SepF n=1 Tax=Gottschalkia purinilytica TaxID=1503 RepID=A0A0L0WB55_GOTPU|nr:cell division protein SepF [Gottschalkia purinilytica]KNF08721.1 hypothetical protein CLPU_5c00280 [Gottschalkia purinilytica]